MGSNHFWLHLLSDHSRAGLMGDPCTGGPMYWQRYQAPLSISNGVPEAKAEALGPRKPTRKTRLSHKNTIITRYWLLFSRHIWPLLDEIDPATSLTIIGPESSTLWVHFLVQTLVTTRNLCLFQFAGLVGTLLCSWHYHDTYFKCWVLFCPATKNVISRRGQPTSSIHHLVALCRSQEMRLFWMMDLLITMVRNAFIFRLWRLVWLVWCDFKL